MSDNNSNAARSVAVTVLNKTPSQLELASSNLSGGVWNPQPPSVISGQNTGTFENDSDGMMTGCQGNCTYQIGSSPITGVLSIAWNDPYMGSDNCSVSVTGPYQVTSSGCSGNNANLVVTLTQG